MRALEQLFHPRGVAIVGAKRDLTQGGGLALSALLSHGYTGRIYAVNPRYPEIGGVPCSPSLLGIDGPCDVAVIALPAEMVIETVRECGERGIGYAIVHSAAFRQVGEAGRAREAELVRTAREVGVRVIGPNCNGVVNVTEGVYSAFGSMARAPNLARGPVSMVYQSGGLGQGIVVSCSRAGLGFRYLLASGNEADVTTPEVISAYLEDPETRIVVAYVEGVADGRALMAAGHKAAELGKIVLVWKVGNTAHGKLAASSHTANMTGSYDVYRAALKQSGIIEVHDLDEIADLAKSFACNRHAKGRRMSVMSASGGAAIALADAADHNLNLPMPTEATQTTLGGLGLDIGNLLNPMDFAPGFLGDKAVVGFEAALRALVDDSNFDQLAVLLTSTPAKAALNGVKAIVAGTDHSDKPVLVFYAVPREEAPEVYQALEGARIPVFESPARLVRAASALATANEASRRLSRPIVVEKSPRVTPTSLVSRTGVLNEFESKELLRCFGIQCSRDQVVSEPELSDDIHVRAPFVVKVLSSDIPHKTEAGAVQLDVPDQLALKMAMTNVLENARRANSQAHIDGVLVSEMVRGGLEALIGTVNDPVFGPTVAFGLGGIMTEILRDVSYRIAPFDRDTAQAMIEELRTAHCFTQAIRGRAPLDLDAVVDTLVKVSELAWVMRDLIAEIDINPLIVLPRGEGAIAADALIVLSPGAHVTKVNEHA